MIAPFTYFAVWLCSFKWPFRSLPKISPCCLLSLQLGTWSWNFLCYMSLWMWHRQYSSCALHVLIFFCIVCILESPCTMYFILRVPKFQTCDFRWEQLHRSSFKPLNYICNCPCQISGLGVWSTCPYYGISKFSWPFRWKYIGYLFGATSLTVFHRLFWNFSDVFCMEWRCARALDKILWLFFSRVFCFVNLSLFSVWNAIKVYRQWVPCGHNSCYSFPLIVLKHCRCFQHVMKMCMWFWYNTLIIFLIFLLCGIMLWLFFSLFLLCDLCLFFFFFFFTWNAIKVYRLWVPCERNSSYSFPSVILKLCSCFRHGMKMCIWFGYNALFFLTFSAMFISRNYVVWPTFFLMDVFIALKGSHFWFSLVAFFSHEKLSKYIDSGYLVGATPLTVFHRLFWNFADVFCMKWRCACGFGIIFGYFFSLFMLCELRLFFTWNAIEVYKQWVPCGCSGAMSDPLTALVFFIYKLQPLDIY